MPPKSKGKGKSRKSSPSRKRSKSRGRSKSKGSKRGKSPRKSRKSDDILADLPVYTAEVIRDALHEVELGESPINLTYPILKKIKLPPIVWKNFDQKPQAMKLTNTAYSVVLSGLWGDYTKPYISGGPFIDDYEFSQIHFHWGQTDDIGSEHKVEGISYPFEMHAVFYKKIYGSHYQAKMEVDGIVIFAFLFKIQTEDNPMLTPVTANLDLVMPSYSETSIEPLPLISLMKSVSDDYIAYLGVMKYKCKHGVLWLLSRTTLGLSEIQLSAFRKLLDKFGNPMPKTYRDVQDLKNRNVYFVSPASDNFGMILHPLMDRKRSRSRRSGSKKRRSKSSKKSKRSVSKKGGKGKGGSKGGSKAGSKKGSKGGSKKGKRK